jgi:hypothetical protein
MYEMENPSASSSSSTTKFGALCGDVLGDALGLGKKITMLALVCSTAGARPMLPPAFWNHDTIQDSWLILLITNQSFEIGPCLKPIRQACKYDHPEQLPHSKCVEQ